MVERAAKVTHLTPIATPRPTHRPPLIIIGGSVRAAVQSAVRAGFATWAADAFADADLSAVSPAIRVTDYPQGFVAALSGAPEGALVYTGALENSPGLLEQLVGDRPLWGNRPEVLRAARDPWTVAAALRDDGIAVPQLLAGTGPPTEKPQSGRPWLRKRRRSAGGEGIRFERPREQGAPPMDAARVDEHYWQEFIPGTPLGAVFIAAEGSSRLWGVSQQLLGRDWPRPGGFHYAGSIGPFPLTTLARRRAERIGQTLTSVLGLSGLFGVDLVLDDHDENLVWPIEVNPRWTASVELVERWSGENAMRLHVDACQQGLLPDWPAEAGGAAGRESPDCYGKLIVYTDRPRTISAEMTAGWLRRNQDRAWPTIADIPAGPQIIPPRWPICTVFGQAVAALEVRRQLVAARDQVLRDCRA